MLFRDSLRTVTAAAFVADVERNAARLLWDPDAPHVVNLCHDRYRFAVLFGACVAAGRTSLLSGDQSPRAVAALAARYGQARPLGDDWLEIAPAGAEPAAAAAAIPAIDSDRVVAIVLTSGSTGEPTASRKRWGELVARSRAAARRFGFVGEPAHDLVGSVPPHHMYGFETTVLLPLHAAVASWCGPFFYPADLRLALQAAAGRSTLVTTPVHLRTLLAPAPGKPVHQVISATAPLDAGLAGRIEREWGTQVLEIFGATEVGSIASRRTVTEPAWRLYPGVTMVPDGETASVQAPFADATRLSDSIACAEDGQGFRLLGRAGDLVKLGGRRASLSGLSRILNRIDGVSDGIFVAPDDLECRPGARLLAFAVAPGRAAPDLLADLRRVIDPVFLPRRLILCEALPRNATGKLARGALLELLGADADG
ncbi:AMP-binding protein [Lichenicoccus sp.]|uniref:AMP-binding protein n=1 Tax=Lichenicoccus sp. TaxID=2781899 RepID=UPI003D1353E4